MSLEPKNTGWTMTKYKVIGFIRGAYGRMKIPPDFYERFDFVDGEEHYGTDYDKWVYFLRNTVIPGVLQDNPDLHKSFFRNVHFMVTTMGVNQDVLFPVVNGKFEPGYMKRYGCVYF